MSQPSTTVSPDTASLAADAVCILCGKRESARLWEGSDKKHRGPGRFCYRQCQNCGLVFLFPPIPDDELARFYPDYVTPVRAASHAPASHRIRQALKRMVAEEWYGYVSADSLRHAWPLRFLRKVMTFPLRPLLRQVPCHQPGGRVLDIGCGSGGYLAFLASLGWTCYGVEPAPNSRTYAQEVLGLNVHPGPVAACGFEAGSFDLVTMWHVIEHLPNPLETLREIHRILKPNGVLRLRTPNAESLEARVFRGNWYGLDPPRHLYLFSPRIIRTLLESGGFSVPRMSYHYDPTDFSRSLLYLMEDVGFRRTHRVVSRYIRTIELGLTACLPFRWMASRGAAMHLETRRVSP